MVFLGLSMARRLGWDGMGWDGYLLVEDFGMLELAMSVQGWRCWCAGFGILGRGTACNSTNSNLMKPTTLDL